MKTAPFNLKKALAGHPLVTRDGRKVTNFRTNSPDPIFPYRVDIEGMRESLCFFTGEGHYWKSGDKDKSDLFLLLPESKRDSKGRFATTKSASTDSKIKQPDSFPFFLPKGTVVDNLGGDDCTATTARDALLKTRDSQTIPVFDWQFSTKISICNILSYPSTYTPPEDGWKFEVMDGKLWIVRQGDEVWLKPKCSDLEYYSNFNSEWRSTGGAPESGKDRNMGFKYRRPWPSAENHFVVKGEKTVEKALTPACYIVIESGRVDGELDSEASYEGTFASIKEAEADILKRCKDSLDNASAIEAAMEDPEGYGSRHYILEIKKIVRPVPSVSTSVCLKEIK